MTQSPLTHLDEQGRARMVDVGSKAETERSATAKGRVVMGPGTLSRIVEGRVPKGDVFGVARIAGILAAKRTAELIPLCHPLPLTSVEVVLEPGPDGASVEIAATAKLIGRTGVEMEALAAVSMAALTLYDMCKAVDRGMRIESIRLTDKRGGKSGDWSAP